MPDTSYSIVNCYFINNISKAVGDDTGNLFNVHSLFEAEMKNKDNFVGFDFGTVWAINPSKNNGFPYLQSLEP